MSRGGGEEPGGGLESIPDFVGPIESDSTDTPDSGDAQGDHTMATFIQDGDAVDYSPGADVAAGEVVVQGDLVAVAKTPIATGTLGSLATCGVFDFAKATGGAISAGAILYWDAANGVATTTASGNKRIGKAVAAAAAADTQVRGLLAP